VGATPDILYSRDPLDARSRRSIARRRSVGSDLLRLRFLGRFGCPRFSVERSNGDTLPFQEGRYPAGQVRARIDRHAWRMGI